MALRALESRLASVTAGNGAIYAVRRAAYVDVDAVMGHDLSLPFNLVKRGWRAVYEPEARATEKMVPTDRGRVRAQAADDEPRLADRPARRTAVAARLPAALRADDRLAPRAALRRAVPARARVVLALGLVRRARVEPRRGAAQVALLAAAAAGGRVRARPLLVARYYVLTTASIVAGLWDHLRHGTPAGWAPPEGTR